MKSAMKTLLLILAWTMIASPALAQTMIHGAASEPRALDPYFYAETPTNSINYNIYDALVWYDHDAKLIPGLAEKWENPDALTWLFYLRKGVKFHDGSDFTAEDVVFSIERCGSWARSGFKDSVRDIAKVEIIDPYKVKITTKAPFAILPDMMVRVMIMSKAHVQKTGDDAQATNPVGTGAYKLKEWIKGDHLTLTANAAYWRGAPRIETVNLRPLTNDATRTAALISSEVHLIDDVPARDLDRLNKDDRLEVTSKPGNRTMMLYLDQARQNSPKVDSPTGKNPLQDVRVRRAIHLGINVEAIIKHIMNGVGEPATQTYPRFIYGYDSSITRPGHNLQKAKELLKEAGYPNGFGITLDATNDRYPNDEQVAQAIAADLSKIGIKVKVNAIPKNNFFPMADKADVSMAFAGWACNPPDAIRFLLPLAHTYDQKLGAGRYNYGRYSNPKVDALAQEASTNMDPKKRLEIMSTASRLLMEDMAFVPLFNLVNVFAKSKKLDWVQRIDQYTWYFDMALK
ncbi:MAG: ABC transporter substrate-binding protein [Deltaproteobacteria bacterium]|nr:ABC transporter substrate-binding protein [Deltaproteobacteria bacterium]